jgi:hypothetical protein
MIGQRVQPRLVPPCPPEFAAEFVRGGWRGVERLYNARTDLLLKWIEMSGGEALYADRRAHLRRNCAGGNGKPEASLEAAA